MLFFYLPYIYVYIYLIPIHLSFFSLSSSSLALPPPFLFLPFVYTLSRLLSSASPRGCACDHAPVACAHVGTCPWPVRMWARARGLCACRHALVVCAVGCLPACRSGKSSLLSAILGEMKQVAGRLALSGSVAYAAQLVSDLGFFVLPLLRVK